MVLLKLTLPSSVDPARFVLIDTFDDNVAAPLMSTMPASVPVPFIVFDVISPPRSTVTAVKFTPVFITVRVLATTSASVVLIAFTLI